MAHIEKFKRSAVGQMVCHTRRMRVDGRYSNERIDPSRTHLNYRLGGVDDVTATIGRVAEGTPRGKLRKDAVAMFSVCVTLPRDWPAGRDPREFFAVCHTFNVGYFGGLAMGGEVHMDETTPHMHDLFCPVTDDGRVCFRDVVPRGKYQRYHDELGAFVREHLGLELAITLDESERAVRALSKADQRSYAKLVDDARETDQKAAEAERRLESPLRAAGRPSKRRCQGWRRCWVTSRPTCRSSSTRCGTQSCEPGPTTARGRRSRTAPRWPTPSGR